MASIDPGTWERAFVERQRVARLATVDIEGRPHLVPIVFALEGHRLFTPIDAKPKRARADQLGRVRRIRANPQVAVLFDEYSDDWSELAWVQVSGTAAFVESGPDWERGMALLSERYEQYANMPLTGRPVIVIEVEQVHSWRASGEA